MRVLVTGGAGYIGSHTCVELLNAGHEVVVYDNFSNGHRGALRRIEKITGKSVIVIEGDVRDRAALKTALQNNACAAVMHFAALKAVGESVAKPLDYFDVNVSGTVALLQAMKAADVRIIVFSSSATVYGTPESLPITESHRLSATNPYGRTKLIAEEMLRDFYAAEPGWAIGILRYFNPVGAHPSGLIGEEPKGVPNNLLPYVAQVAVKRRTGLRVWGGDYATIDGTGVRDYIHVVDLALGHLKALQRLQTPQCFAVNLGTGKGHSVLDVVKAFEEASECPVPYQISDRRPGDVAECFASPEMAKNLLNWSAQHDLAAMCRDHWRWQKTNPRGYP